MRLRAVVTQSGNGVPGRIDEHRGGRDRRRRARSVRYAGAPAATAAPMKSCPSRSATIAHEQLACDQSARIVRRAVDGDIVTDDRTVDHQSDL